MNQLSKLAGFGFVLYILLTQLAYGVSDSDSEWRQWLNSQGSDTPSTVVQNRLVEKEGRFQLSGPSLGFSDRRDFTVNWFVSAGARFHFTEMHGWEMVRMTFASPSESSLASEIRESTGFKPDSQLSRFQISTAYVFTPIYGKYAWGAASLVHFDIFATLGAGVRFAVDRQPFAEIGIGMNHFIWAERLSVVPEFRMRSYGEKRSQSTTVFESVFSLGVAWLW